MKIFRLNEQELHAAFGIQMASVDAFPDAANGPGVSYGVIEPGGISAFHRHDESELFAILAGSGVITPDHGPEVQVGAGDLVTIGPFDKHVLRNAGTDRLVFADIYWRDSAAAVARSSGADGVSPRKPYFVFSTPPTPNGDLHLGHLSGPYLGADVFARFQRMRGEDAYHITGSDDYQSYVIAKGRQLGKEPQAVADHFGKEILETLRLLDVQVDQYTLTSRSAGYAEGLQEFFDRAAATRSVVRRADNAAFDPQTDAYLYECDVGGRCPTCNAGCGGNICEECGEPNLVVDMKDAVSRLSGKPPVTKPFERYVLDLADCADHIRDKLREGKAAPRLLALADSVLQRENLRFPISHPQPWGVPPKGSELPGQVIWVWPEMSYGFLYGVEALGRQIGRDWSALSPQDDWQIVHFFGYDNSFYHTIMYPALYRLAFPEWKSSISYHMNEFYLLDGLKFSTSRQHAVWGKEVLNPDSVDAVRYHLCLTRGEVKRADFNRAALASTNDTILGEWDRWLSGLGDAISRRYGGLAPDAGDWSIDQREFLRQLEARRARIETMLSPDAFSLNQAALEVDGIVRDTVRFAEAHRQLSAVASASDRNRTTIALELAAALLLADATTALMPRFAGRLRNALGVADERRWPAHVSLLPPGTKVSLEHCRFFSGLKKEGDSGATVENAA
ncbi:class I tRNA ligase family protein [uncultured Bradyrhizobium sp.]|uniref:class I tRNA ligase family protein n=1 Tax=uncultured Bradyrhizobium sp. TaxID=199684 RepID=UPI0035C9AF67